MSNSNINFKMNILHKIDKFDEIYGIIYMGGLIMSTNVEDYKKIEELFSKMPESDKNKLKEYLSSHKEEFQIDPVETVRKGLEEIVKQAIEKSSTPEPIDYAKTFNDQSRVESGKALYDSLVTDGRVQEEILQQKREAMYIDKEIKPVEPIPVKNYIDNNYIMKQPYINEIGNGTTSENIIREKDPHTKLLEELKSKFASMSYADLYEFVKGFYFIQDDTNYQELPVNSQQMAWNNEMHTQHLSHYFDFNYYLKNGITPEEFISTAFETYKNHEELNRQGKTM